MYCYPFFWRIALQHPVLSSSRLSMTSSGHRCCTNRGALSLRLCHRQLQLTTPSAFSAAGHIQVTLSHPFKAAKSTQDGPRDSQDGLKSFPNPSQVNNCTTVSIANSSSTASQHSNVVTAFAEIVSSPAPAAQHLLLLSHGNTLGFSIDPALPTQKRETVATIARFQSNLR